MRVDIEEILEIEERENKLNQIPFKEIEWYLKGKQINLSEEEIEEWDLTGLSNLYFIICEEYKKGVKYEILL